MPDRTVFGGFCSDRTLVDAQLKVRDIPWEIIRILLCLCLIQIFLIIILRHIYRNHKLRIGDYGTYRIVRSHLGYALERVKLLVQSITGICRFHKLGGSAAGSLVIGIQILGILRKRIILTGKRLLILLLLCLEFIIFQLSHQVADLIGNELILKLLPGNGRIQICPAQFRICIVSFLDGGTQFILGIFQFLTGTDIVQCIGKENLGVILYPVHAVVVALQPLLGEFDKKNLVISIPGRIDLFQEFVIILGKGLLVNIGSVDSLLYIGIYGADESSVMSPVQTVVGLK